MTSIANLGSHAGARISGIYRLISIKRLSSQCHEDRAQVTVADATGFAVCHVSLTSAGFVGLTDVRSRFVTVTGGVKVSAGGTVCVDADRIERVAKPDRPSWHLMSRTWVPVEASDAFDQLIALLDRLKGAAIRSFAHRLFASQAISEPFLCVPASRAHHHAIAGGLLIHSVECAQMAESLASYVLASHERDLAVMGALLHDLAKIRIMKWGRRSQYAIYGVTQEALNLEVLSPFMQRFDRDWPEGGAGLREMLAPARQYGHGRHVSPLLLTDLVRYIDRLSSGADIRAQSFRDSPAWRHCAKTEQGDLVKRVLPAIDRATELRVAP